VWLVNIVFKMVGKWVYYCPQTCGKIDALSWLLPSKPLEIFLAFLRGQLSRYVGTLYPYKIILSTIHESLYMQLILHFKWECLLSFVWFAYCYSNLIGLFLKELLPFLTQNISSKVCSCNSSFIFFYSYLSWFGNLILWRAFVCF